MAKFPSLPLFTDAFISDTMHLNAAQTGAYVMLLMCAWRSKDCSIPNDDSILARYARMDLRTWKANKKIIMEFWDLNNETQKFSQRRLLDERNYVVQKQSKNSKAGRASALKRKERDSTDVQPKSNENSTPTPTPTPTPSLEKNNTKKDFQPDDVSDEAWKEFKKHRAKKKAIITEMVLSRMRSEADKAGISLEQAMHEAVYRNWQAFSAKWYLEKEGGYNESITDRARRAAFDA